ncbi:hypothetical protein MNBD_ALPHA06-1188 [hydrothermal vent metagenome]|uniref:DinB-like domain-containing protein n=1 Tax=hydrothermal vent metagenome TaxID=652676 RepID=A0A3B0RMF6_9ZZZZ
MFTAIKNNLTVGVELVSSLSDTQYRDTSVEPYHSSIGSHIRHVLDIFDCIFSGLQSGQINLAARSRNLDVEQDRQIALAYFAETFRQLDALQTADMNQIVQVSDDLGTGEITCNYTLGAALVQAHSHAIHHFASLGYIVSKLGLALPNSDFGYNPTTPQERRVN